jgi:hypothetical protein
MTLELFCIILIALLVGVAIAFNGYRWFLILLPIFGFVFGFGLGAQTLQAIFGQELFATAASWVLGLIVGVIFAVLSYLFYFIGVGIYAAALGYGLGVGLMGLFGLDLNLITWLVGIAAAVGMVFVVFKFNIQKYVIIIGSALIGASVIVASLLFPLGVITYPQLTKLELFEVLAQNFFWLIVFIALAAGGIYTQIVSTRNFTLEVKDPMSS